MAYLKITPAVVESSLRSIERGTTPKIPPSLVAHYVLSLGLQTAKQRKQQQADDFVAFADQLYARTDSRQVSA